MVLSIETYVSFADHLRWSQPQCLHGQAAGNHRTSANLVCAQLDSFWIELPPWLGAHKPRPRTRHRIRSRFSIDGPTGVLQRGEERLMAREAMEKWQGSSPEVALERLAHALLASNEFVFCRLMQHPISNGNPIWSRRRFLHRAGMGMGGMALGHMLSQEAFGSHAQATHFPGKAKHVIHVFLNGGMSQVDTFDPKPELDRWEAGNFPLRICKPSDAPGWRCLLPFHSPSMELVVSRSVIFSLISPAVSTSWR